MTNTWFTSDHHIGHKLVSELRGFDGTGEHDRTLARKWDAVVGPDDVVWVLGDTAMSDHQSALIWFRDRPGRKRLIPGNHDSIFGGHRGSQKALRTEPWELTFETIQAFARIRVAGQSVLLSHFPYPGTSEGIDSTGRPYDDRYAQYRLPNLGLPLIHGHTHRPDKISGNLCAGSMTPQIHIGLDAWDLAPVPLSEIESLLQLGSI